MRSRRWLDDLAAAGRPNRGAFFPLHDLTHYAVETELGFSRGFYGLIAAGWEIADTTGKGTRGPLPNEAIEVEYIVGALGAERSGGAISTAEEFNQLAATFAHARGMPEPRALTDEELTKVRARIDELFLKWRTLPGATLELLFPGGVTQTAFRGAATEESRSNS